MDAGDFDPDGDGYLASGGDCDDDDATVYPGAPDPRKAAYHTKGKMRGKPIEGVIVNNDEELAAALGLEPPEPAPAQRNRRNRTRCSNRGIAGYPAGKWSP